jgi:hypothetical protein
MIIGGHEYSKPSFTHWALRLESAAVDVIAALAIIESSSHIPVHESRPTMNGHAQIGHNEERLRMS